MSIQSSNTQITTSKYRRIRFFFFRMLFMMVVSLYTSRVILNALGVEDFGIYDVVGGVVAMQLFIDYHDADGICGRMILECQDDEACGDIMEK